MSKYWGLIGFLLILGVNQSTLAQITPDNTLGSESSVINSIDEMNERIDGGAQRGANLFHSFSDFNINEGRSVYFANLSGIENILTRVTGRNPSNIFGKLGVLGEANLFLINPNGIIFGPNSSLDIQGSFTATTADGIMLGKNGIFNASEPENSNLLSISPGVLFFNQVAQQPGNIINEGNLTTKAGDISLIANGDIFLKPDSSITSEDLLGGNIILRSNGTIDVNEGTISSQGGDINITANNLSLSNQAEIITSTNGQTNAGNIFIDVLDAVTLDGYSGISSVVEAEGNASTGTINIKANSLTITNISSIITTVSPEGQGKAGDININISGTLIVDGILNNNDEIFNNEEFSKISSFLDQDATGSSGNINIQASSLVVSNGGGIDNSLLGQGEAGDIVIKVTDFLTMTPSSLDENLDRDSSIGSAIVGQGKGGDVMINAPNATISLDGFTTLILSNIGVELKEEDDSFNGQGQAGNIYITARSLSLTNGAGIAPIILSQESPTNIPGNIYVEVSDFISISSGSFLQTSSFGNGNSGDITIYAPNAIISVDGIIKDNPSTILSLVFADGIGNSGNINLTAKSLFVTNGAQILASNFGEGDAGNLIINISDTLIASGGSSLRTDVLGQGEAGTITINASTANISFDGTGLVPVESVTNQTELLLIPSGVASGVNLSLELGLVGKGTGNDISITAKTLSLSNGAEISSASASIGEGDGGNITLNADLIIAFDDSNILAFAREGRGGNITLNTPVFFGENFDSRVSERENLEELDRNGRVDINASGVISGIVTLPDLSFIQNSLTELPENLINTETLLTRSCVVPSQEEGKFIITGSGNLPERPGINSVSPYPTREVQTTDDSSWQPGDSIVEPQGFYRLTDGRLILSRECSLTE